MNEHWIWLAERRGIGARSRAALLRMFGTAERIYALTAEQCRRTENFDERWLASLMDKSLDHAKELLRKCDEHGIRILTYADEAYPERLRNIVDPPTLLYYRGEIPDIDNEAVIAVVGSRRCSTYALLHSRQFAHRIASSGGIVVSGGARGIDTMALYGALDSYMPVICVMGCGLDINYPRENKELFQKVACHGCLISEYPPGTPPIGSNFPVRNRILSGLSLGVLVVEASARSGALITANHALEQGRDVYAIPSQIGLRHSEGSNRLIREGAEMVENGWEILKGYRYLFPDKLSDGNRRESVERELKRKLAAAQRVYAPIAIDDGGKKDVDNPANSAYSDECQEKLSQDERVVLSHLSQELVAVDKLIEACELPTQRVLAALTMLQIKHLALKLPGNFYQRKYD